MGYRRQLADGDLQEFLGTGMGWRCTVLGDVFLVFLGSVECSGTAQKLMSDFRLVFGLVLGVMVLEGRYNVIRR